MKKKKEKNYNQKVEKSISCNYCFKETHFNNNFQITMQNNNEIKLHFTEIFTNENGKKGIKHPDGRILAPAIYDDIFIEPELPNHFFYRKDGNNRLGLMSMGGREVTPCIIDTYSCEGQTVYFKSGDRQGLWQWAIDELLEPIYDEIKVLDIEKPTLFTLNGEKGYVKVSDHSFIPASKENTMDADAWHDLLLECICDQYNDLD